VDANRDKGTPLRQFAADPVRLRTSTDGGKPTRRGYCSDGLHRRRKEQTMAIPIPREVRQPLAAERRIEAG
jgi:hypothetical protein